jgi:NAD(P)-dependent dehydrogenase (short-subunit alcohol dehydrogenase family)
MPASSPRVALVTGSGKKQVGWYVADALAGHGFAIAVHYHTKEEDRAIPDRIRQGSPRWGQGHEVRGSRPTNSPPRPGPAVRPSSVVLTGPLRLVDDGLHLEP